MEWVRADLVEGEDQRDRAAWSPFVLHRDRLLGAAADLLRNVTDADAAVFRSQGVTSRIPALGLTFREAADRARDLLARAEASHERDEDDEGPAAAERIVQQGEADRLHDAILAAPPVTVADLSVKLERLTCPIFGVGAFVHPNHLQNLAEDVRRMIAAVPDYHGMPTTTIPEIGITFAEAAEREEGELSAMLCRWLELRDIVSPTKRQMAEHDRLSNRISGYQPRTSADALALLVFVLTCYMGDSIIELEDDGSCYARALQKGLAYFASAGDPAAGTLYRLGLIGLTDARAFWVNSDARHEQEDAEAFSGEADDDAELLDLWRQYLPLKAEAERINEATATGDPEAWERAHKPCDELEDRMAAIPARTPTGIAVKLAVLWQWGGAYVEGGKAGNERENGPSYLSDFMTRWLWMIMNEARALGAPMSLLPNDVTTDPSAAAAESRRLVLRPDEESSADPFSDAVEDIGAQASATLSMPLEMTDRMIDAGASAAGITPEQFKAAVQAARDARAA